jgi:hypothetical protein
MSPEFTASARDSTKSIFTNLNAFLPPIFMYF